MKGQKFCLQEVLQIGAKFDIELTADVALCLNSIDTHYSNYMHPLISEMTDRVF